MLTGQHKIKQSLQREWLSKPHPLRKRVLILVLFEYLVLLALNSDRPGYIPVLPLISSMILSKSLNLSYTFPIECGNLYLIWENNMR